MAGCFLSRATPARAIYTPYPTSAEDLATLKESGLEIRMFRFLDQKAGGIDWDGLREDLQDAAPRSAVLLHVSGSVPSGAEFTAPQWRLLTTILHVSCSVVSR